jgi:hypothetical protein
VEDTLDLVLWHPDEKRLEIVDFQLQPLKPFDPAWPSSSVLVKYYLAEKLKTRWQFEKLTLTTYRVGTQSFQPICINVEESIYKLHWAELVKTLDEMKDEKSENSTCALHAKGSCRYCNNLVSETVNDKPVDVDASFRLSA